MSKTLKRKWPTSLKEQLGVAFFYTFIAVICLFAIIWSFYDPAPGGEIGEFVAGVLTTFVLTVFALAWLVFIEELIEFKRERKKSTATADTAIDTKEDLEQAENEDVLTDTRKCYAVRVSGWIHVKANSIDEAAEKARDQAGCVIHELSDIIDSDVLLRGGEDDEGFDQWYRDNWENDFR